MLLRPLIAGVTAALLLAAAPSRAADPTYDGHMYGDDGTLGHDAFVAYGQQDFNRALTAALAGAKKGDPLAQAVAGYAYMSGTGTEMDLTESAKWFTKAAERGRPVAQRMLGVFYKQGNGVEKNPQTALTWLQRASLAGDTDAQYFMGVIYWENKGIPVDMAQAYMWLEVAALQNNAKGLEAQPAARSYMTPEQIEKAQGLAKTCLSQHFKDCGK